MPPERPSQIQRRRPGARVPLATSCGAPASVRITRKRVALRREMPLTRIAISGAFGPTTWPGLMLTTRGRGGVVSSVISFGLTTERPCSSRVPRTR